MMIDKSEHKDFLLQALNAISIPTAHVDFFIEVRNAVRNAGVVEGGKQLEVSPSEFDSLVP